MGMWQLDRLDQRHERNELIHRNLDAMPAPVGQVARVGRDLSPKSQWRLVVARGRYDVDHELLVRNRVLNGTSGYHVVTPLVTVEGVILLVNRGWVRPGQTASSPPEVPRPAPGLVTVHARMRPSEPSAGGDPAPAGQVRRIDVRDIARSLPYPVYGGYAELVRESPARKPAPTPLPPPQVSEGPHLAYAFQWFVFAIIAVGGVILLARREVEDENTAREDRVKSRA